MSNDILRRKEGEELDTYLLRLRHLICLVRTYLDIILKIKNRQTGNGFWDLTWQVFYDAIVIKTCCILETNNSKTVNIPEMLKIFKKVHPDKEHLISSHVKSLAEHRKKFMSIRSYHHAHDGFRSRKEVPRYIDLKDLIEILSLSEKIVLKCRSASVEKTTEWKTNELAFKSMYAGGHASILEYLDKLLLIEI